MPDNSLKNWIPQLESETQNSTSDDSLKNWVPKLEEAPITPDDKELSIADTLLDDKSGTSYIIPWGTTIGGQYSSAIDFGIQIGNALHNTKSEDPRYEKIKRERLSKYPLPPKSEEIILPESPGMGPMGYVSIVVPDKNDKERKEVEQKRNQIKEALYKVYGGESERSITRGIQSGVMQNIELVTGLDLPRNWKPLELTEKEIDRLVQDGDIDSEEAKLYKKNSFYAGLLEASTGAIVNSLMIAGEIAATAPRMGAALTKEGIKFFSKEGLKTYGKELLKQGANSYRVMGIGANIRANRLAIAELDEMEKNGENASLGDALGIISKHYFRENISAWMEGVSEGMLDELKFGSVGLKQLAKFNGQAWKNFGTNVVKKQFLGTTFETFTEQVTDVTGDIMSGENVFTRGSNALNIILGESDQVKRQALTNLLVEGITGFVLGNAMGVSDMFSRKVYEELDQQVKKGNISQVEAATIAMAIKDPKQQAKVIDALQEEKKKDKRSPGLKDLDMGLRNFVNFGGRDEVDFTHASPKDHSKGITGVTNDAIQNAILATGQSYDAKSQGVKWTALDRVLEHGKQDAISYVLAIHNKVNNESNRKAIADEHNAMSLTPKQTNAYAQNLVDTATLEATNIGLNKEFTGIGTNIEEDTRNRLLSDIYAGIYLGYQNKGWDTVERHYKEQLNPNSSIYNEQIASIKNLINKAKEVKKSNQENLKKGVISLNKTHQVFIDEMQQPIASQSFDEVMDQKRKDNSLNEVRNDLSDAARVLAQEDLESNFDIHEFENFYKSLEGDITSEQLGDFRSRVRDNIVTWDDQTPNTNTRGTNTTSIFKIIQQLGLNDNLDAFFRDKHPGLVDINDLRTGGQFEFMARAMLKFISDKNLAKGLKQEDLVEKIRKKAIKEKLAEDRYFATLPFLKDRAGSFNIVIKAIDGHYTALEWDEKIKKFLYISTANVSNLSLEAIRRREEHGITLEQAIYLDAKVDIQGLFGLAVRGASSVSRFKDFPDHLKQIDYTSTSVKDGSPKYSEIIGNFQGKTLNDFLNHLINNNLIQEKDLSELIKILAKSVGDVPVSIETLPLSPKGNLLKGAFIPAELNDPLGSRIIINPDAFARISADDVAKTTIHEALHAFTHSFLNSAHPAARKLKSQLEGIIHSMDEVLRLYKAMPNYEDFAKLGIWKGTRAQLDNYLTTFSKNLAYYTKKNIEIKNKEGKVTGYQTMLNVDEFVAGLFDNASDSLPIREFLANMPASGLINPLSVRYSRTSDLKTIFRRIFSFIPGIDKKVGERTMLDMANQIFWDHTVQAGIEEFHQLRVQHGGTLTARDFAQLRELQSHYKSNFEDTGETIEEIFSELDDDQQEQELESREAFKARLESKSFTALLLDITDTMNIGIEEKAATKGLADFMEAIRSLTSIKAFREHLMKLDKASYGMVSKRLTAIWERNYKDKWSKEEFIKYFTAATFRHIRSSRPRTFIRLQTNYYYDPEILSKGELYKTTVVKDGTQDSAKFVRGDTVLDSFVPLLNHIFGLKEEDHNTVSIHFISGFDTLREGEIIDEGKNLKKLTNYNLGFKKDKTPVTDNLSVILAREENDPNFRYIYLGNFAGKSTVPVLAVPKNAWHKVTGVLSELEKFYKGSLNIGETKGMSSDMMRSNIARIMLEELYRGASFVQKDGHLQPDKSQILDKDLNAIYKRGTAFLTQVERININIDDFDELIQKRQLSGIKLNGNDVDLRTAILDLEDEKPIEITLKDGSKKLTTIKEMFINSLDTPYYDGASIYLLDEFDTIYNGVFGNLNQGTIKNFYSSFAGEKPIFIKHAMHGITKDSELGRFMIQHGLAILSTKDAVKIRPTITVERDGQTVEEDSLITGSDYWEAGTKIPNEKILTLKLSKFYHKKNEENNRFMSGVTKQWFNGSSFVRSNPVYKALGVEDNIVDIMNRLTDRAQKRMLEEIDSMCKPENLLELTLEIIDNPQGTREQRMAETFKFLKYIKPELLKREAGNVITIPSVAVALRNRVMEKISDRFNGYIPGARLALRFNSGFFEEESNIESITHPKAQRDLLFSTLPMSDPLWEVLVPDTFIRQRLQTFRNLTEREEASYRRGKKAEGKSFFEERKKIIQDIRKWAANEIEKERLLFQSMKTGKGDVRLKEITRLEIIEKAETVADFMDMNHPRVKAYLNETIWGKDVIENEKPVYKPGILNRNTGKLAGNNIIIDEDTARKRGWKVGDRIIAVITPTDSPLGIMAVRIAGIAKSGSVNNNTVIFNSELIQTLNGKDFDIDTISLIGFDENYWNHGDFSQLHQMIGDAQNVYKSKVAETVKKVLKREKRIVYKAGTNIIIPVNEDTVFNSKEVREEYMIAMNGPHPQSETNKRKFSIVGKDFQFVDSAYLVDVSPIITERLKHTALSAINFQSKIKDKEFKVNHSKWMETHVFHLFDTNFSVDFPGQTSKLVYNSDARSNEYKTAMFDHFFGDKAKDLDSLGQKTINDFISWMLAPAFALTKQQDISGESLDYIQMKRMILDMQTRLKLLDVRGKKKAEARQQLKTLYDKNLAKQLDELRKKYGNTHKRYIEAFEANIEASLTIKEFIDNITIDSIDAYPLFRTILNLNTDEIPTPGTSYEDWLIDSCRTARALLGSSSYIAALWNKQTATNEKGEMAGAIVNALTVPQNVAFREARAIEELLKIRRDNVSDLGNTDEGKAARSEFKRKYASFINSYSETFKDSQRGHIKRIDLLLENPEILEIYKKFKIKPANLGKFEDLLDEYRAVRKEIGQFYPTLKQTINNKEHEYEVDSTAILLSLLTRQSDWTSQRHRIIKHEGTKVLAAPKAGELTVVRDEVISLVHAFEEQSPSKTLVLNDKTKKMEEVEQEPSEAQLYFRTGRQNTFPILMKVLLEKNRFKTKNRSLFRSVKESSRKNLKDFAEFKIKEFGTVSAHITTDGRLKFEYIDSFVDGQGIEDAKRVTIYHDALVQEAKKDPESRSAQLYRALTSQDGAWRGVWNEDQGFKNRIELANLLRFSDNLSYQERVELGKQHLIKRLYSANKFQFNQFEREIFWISLLGQVTNKGLRDNKGQNLIFNKTQWNDERPLDFTGNEVTHELMSYFEPNLWHSWVYLYGQEVINRDRYTKDIGIKMVEQAPIDNPGWLEGALAQEDLSGEVTGVEKATVQEASLLFVNYIDTLQEGVQDISEFKKMVKAQPNKEVQYKEGVNALTNLTKSMYAENRLLKYGIPLNQLREDIKKLTLAEFNNKYSALNPIDMQLDLARLKRATTEEEVLRKYLGTDPDMAITEGTNIAKLWRVFKTLKKAERSLSRTNKAMGNIFKKTVLNLYTFVHMGPLSERKTRVLDRPEASVGFVFTKDSFLGKRNIVHGDLAATRSLVPTHQKSAFGEISIAIAKIEAIDRELNNVRGTLSNQLDASIRLTSLLTGEAARDEWKADHPKNETSDPFINFITDSLPRLSEQKPEDIFELEEEAFLRAENISKTVKNGGMGLRWRVDDISHPERAYLVDETQEEEYEEGPEKEKKTRKKQYRRTKANNEDPLFQLIKDKFYKFPVSEQLKIMAALNIRKLYDIEVPALLSKVRSYIFASYNQLESLAKDGHIDLHNMQALKAMLNRYDQYLEATRAHYGEYIPHRYYTEERKLKFFKEDKESAKTTLMARINYHQDLKRKGEVYDSRYADIMLGRSNAQSPTGKGQEAFDELFNQELEAHWKEKQEENVGNPSTYMMTNFLRRDLVTDPNYIKADKVHLEYIAQLITTFRNDLKTADMSTFETTARANGERANMIQMTMQWYADQVENKLLHTNPISLKKVKRGMQINFRVKGTTLNNMKSIPTNSIFDVWGIVKKIDHDKEELHLYVDKERKKVDLEIQLAKLKSIEHTIATTEVLTWEFPFDVLQNKGFLADEYDASVLRNALQRKLLTADEIKAKQRTIKIGSRNIMAMSREDAVGLSKLAIQRQLQNIDSIGVYKFSDFHIADAFGQPLSGMVNRYKRRGSIEYLDSKVQELKNIKEMDGMWSNSMDAIKYASLRVLSGTTTVANGMYKRLAAMVYLGGFAAPKAYIQNKGGAILSNILDAPIHNSLMWWRARQSYKKLKSYKPEDIAGLTSAEREWYNFVTSLGLLDKNTFTSVVLGSANLDPIDTLKGDNYWDKLRYLYRAAKLGKNLVKELTALNVARQAVLTNTDPNKAWEVQLNWIDATNALNKKIRSKSVKKAPGGPARLTADIGDRMSIPEAIKAAIHLTGTSFFRGPMGIGLQAKAERERFHAFYIGYHTAIENGHESPEAVLFGLNSVKMRHAYYSPEYKSFGANTKLGGSLYQFAQYQNNSWLSTFKLMRDGWEQVGEAMSHEKELWRKGRVLLSRTIAERDAAGNKIRQKADKEKFIQSTNQLRVVGCRLFLTTLLASIGTKAFWGLPNMLDPLGQTLYRLLELISSAGMGGDQDEDETIRRLMTDMMFPLGTVYKTLGTLAMIQEDETVPELLTRGRFNYQADVIRRSINTLKSWEEIDKNDKTLSDLSFWLDSVTGIKLYGFSGNMYGAQDVKEDIFGGWGPVNYPPKRFIPHEPLFGNKMNNFDYYQYGQINKGERINRIFDLYTYLPPVLDNFIYGWK